MKQILFIHTYNSPFIRRDLKVLQEEFSVEDLDLSGMKQNIIGKVITIYKIASRIPKNSVTFVWFADFRAFVSVILGKLFRRKVVVVVGGYELAKFPQYNYGALLTKFGAWRVKQILKLATKILAVDDSLKLDAENLLKKELNSIITIPTGYDSLKFFANEKKQDLVLTVAVVASENKAKLKGLEAFIAVAKLLPNIQFMIIGISDEAYDWVMLRKTENLTILPKISEENLLEYYQKAKVYCQLSCREGLPNALCEAMLCECIPVGTSHNGIPTAIGDTGYYAKFNNVVSTKMAIEKALLVENGKNARERIIQLFPKSKRKEELVKLIGELL